MDAACGVSGGGVPTVKSGEANGNLRKSKWTYAATDRGARAHNYSYWPSTEGVNWRLRTITIPVDSLIIRPKSCSENQVNCKKTQSI
jgi:hypothetical protein